MLHLNIFDFSSIGALEVHFFNVKKFAFHGHFTRFSDTCNAVNFLTKNKMTSFLKSIDAQLSKNDLLFYSSKKMS